MRRERTVPLTYGYLLIPSDEPNPRLLPGDAKPVAPVIDIELPERQGLAIRGTRDADARAHDSVHLVGDRTRPTTGDPSRRPRC